MPGVKKDDIAANLGFEADLWKAADAPRRHTLRNAVSWRRPDEYRAHLTQTREDTKRWIGSFRADVVIEPSRSLFSS